MRLITGESAGAASVHFHVLSYASRGLFHNAISQSGSANAVWATQSNPREEATFLAEYVQCPINGGMSKMIACVRSKPARDLVLAVRNFQVIKESLGLIYDLKLGLRCKNLFLNV